MCKFDQLAVSSLGDVQQGRDDEMLNPFLLSDIDGVLSLRQLDVRVRRLPVIGDKEHGMSATNDIRKGGLRAQISL